MAFGDLPNKLELAAVALLAANPIAGLVGFAGQSKADQSRPALIAKAEQGEEFPQGTGNFNMTLTLQIQTSADDMTLEDHRAYVAGAVDVFRDVAAAANLSAQQADFTVLGILNAQYRTEVEDRAFVSELTLPVYCCASDI